MQEACLNGPRHRPNTTDRETLQGKRKAGRPAGTWRGTEGVDEERKETEESRDENEVRRTVRGRFQWRRFVSAFCSSEVEP